MSWEKFQKFEAKFFPIYMESLKNDFQSLGIAEDEKWPRHLESGEHHVSDELFGKIARAMQENLQQS